MSRTVTKQLTHERLLQVLAYDAETGVFTWRLRTSIRVKVGSQAGTLRKDGYIYVGIDGGKYLLHRLAYFYQHRRWPAVDVDHINGNRADNRASNLRDATRSENMQNRREANSNNLSTGVLGVYKARKRFRAKIEIDYESRSLGYFDTIEEAAAAYATGKAALHPASVAVGGPRQ